MKDPKDDHRMQWPTCKKTKEKHKMIRKVFPCPINSFQTTDDMTIKMIKSKWRLKAKITLTNDSYHSLSLMITKEYREIYWKFLLSIMGRWVEVPPQKSWESSWKFKSIKDSHSLQLYPLCYPLLNVKRNGNEES